MSKGKFWPVALEKIGARGFEPPASPTPKVRATPAPRPDSHATGLVWHYTPDYTTYDFKGDKCSWSGLNERY